MSPGLGLYVRTVLPSRSSVSGRAIPVAVVVPRLLTNTARLPIWSTGVRVCVRTTCERSRTRQEARPARLRAAGPRASNRRPGLVARSTGAGIGWTGRTGPASARRPRPSAVHRSPTCLRARSRRVRHPATTDVPHRPRQPHRPGVRRPDHRRHHPGRRPRPDQDRRRRARARGLRPRLRQHRLVPELGHLHRRRQGHPRVPRLPDRAAGREVELPRGRLPADPRRAADQGRVRRVGARDHLPHVRARERQELHAGLPLRRPPDGHADGLGRRAVDVLPRVAQHPRRRQPAHADRPDDRQDADARRLGVPARAGQALRLPRQRPRLHRQLPLDAVQDERAEVRGRRAAGQGARRAVHPARRPRAELLDQRGPLGRLLAGRPLLRGRGRRRRALRPAARRRQRGRAADAAPDRHEGQHPRRSSRA